MGAGAVLGDGQFAYFYQMIVYGSTFVLSYVLIIIYHSLNARTIHDVANSPCQVTFFFFLPHRNSEADEKKKNSTVRY